MPQSEEKKTDDQAEKPPGKAASDRRTASAGRLPEPDFKMFLSGLAGQGLIHLGLVDNPMTGKREPDLNQAKYTIDLLQILRDKTRGNLDPDEEKALDGMLYDLRMRYVEGCR